MAEPERQFDLAQCRLHTASLTYGSPLPGTKCPCCSRPPKQPLPYLFPQSQLHYSGSLLPASLSFTRMLLCLSLLLMGYTAPLTYFYIRESTAQTWLLKLSSISALQGGNLELAGWLMLVVWVGWGAGWVWTGRQLGRLNQENAQTGFFPTGYAVFCWLPFTHFSEQDISTAIQDWWQRETKSNSKIIHSMFPELFISQEDSEDSSSPVQSKGVLEKVVSSYDLPAFEAAREEVQSLLEEFRSQSALKDQLQAEKAVALCERRKHLLQQVPRNSCCLLIFRRQQYAQYFQSRTSGPLLFRLLFPDRFRLFELQQKTVTTNPHLFPSEINWQVQHINPSWYLSSWMVVLMCGFMAAGMTVGMVELHSFNQVTAYVWLLAAIGLNLILLFGRVVVKCMWKKEQHWIESHRLMGLVYKQVILSLLVMVVAPFITLWFYGNLFFSADCGFVSISPIAVAIFMVFNQLNRFINWIAHKCSSACIREKLSQQEVNEKMAAPTPDCAQQLADVSSVIACSMVLAPYVPWIFVAALLWLLLQFALERISLVCFYSEDSAKGTDLVRLTLSFLQWAALLFSLSHLSLILIARHSLNLSLSQSSVILHAVIGSLGFICSVMPWLWIGEQYTSSWGGRSYAEALQDFVCLYESTNAAWMYGVREGRGRALSTRLKINEEMNTMSKTLSLSLKERLMGYQQSVFGGMQKCAQVEPDQVNNLYFEYERKIHMPKSKPRIPIPPLFRKQNTAEPIQEAVNFYSVFSEDDHQAKQALKQHIRKKLTQDELN